MEVERRRRPRRHGEARRRQPDVKSFATTVEVEQRILIDRERIAQSNGNRPSVEQGGVNTALRFIAVNVEPNPRRETRPVESFGRAVRVKVCTEGVIERERAQIRFFFNVRLFIACGISVKRRPPVNALPAARAWPNDTKAVAKISQHQAAQLSQLPVAALCRSGIEAQRPVPLRRPRHRI